MDNLDRTFRQLVRVIRAQHPSYLTSPFTVTELVQTVLPYRHHRRELALETNQDYEAAISELLTGSRGYLLVDERMRDALTKELASPNSDTGAFREFADAQVSLNPEAVRAVDGSAATATSTSASASAASAPTLAMPVSRPAASAPAAPRPAAAPPAASAAAAPASAPASAGKAPRVAGGGCPYCGGDLPAGRELRFCPHCGQDLTITHCKGCGAELEVGWRFCVTCGRTAGS
ncbi:MAG: Double zinc ribbon [Gemmatimonadetes bacterium]|nr:Double zinc ribbon [Gemmatimonadota bacterium]